MNAPIATPLSDVRVELREEISRLLYSVSIHAGIGMDYSQLGHDEGLFYALKDAAACMKAAITFQRALANANAKLEKGGPGEQGR